MSKKTIKNLIALGKIEEAMEGLLVLSKDADNNDKVIELSRKFEEFKINTNERLFHEDEQKWDNIIRSFLYILDQYESPSPTDSPLNWSSFCYKKIIFLFTNVKAQIKDNIVLIVIFVVLWWIFKVENPTKPSPKKVVINLFYKYKFVDFENTPFVNGILFVNGIPIKPNKAGIFFVPIDMNYINLVGKFEVGGIPCYNRDLPIPSSLDSVILIKTTCP